MVFSSTKTRATFVYYIFKHKKLQNITMFVHDSNQQLGDLRQSLRYSMKGRWQSPFQASLIYCLINRRHVLLSKTKIFCSLKKLKNSQKNEKCNYNKRKNVDHPITSSIPKTETYRVWYLLSCLAEKNAQHISNQAQEEIRHFGWEPDTTTGPNFMALLIVSKESALTDAGNSALTSCVFHGLAGILCLCSCVLHITRHSSIPQLAQKFGACSVSGEW